MTATDDSAGTDEAYVWSDDFSNLGEAGTTPTGEQAFDGAWTEQVFGSQDLPDPSAASGEEMATSQLWLQSAPDTQEASLCEDFPSPPAAVSATAFASESPRDEFVDASAWTSAAPSADGLQLVTLPQVDATADADSVPLDFSTEDNRSSPITGRDSDAATASPVASPVACRSSLGAWSGAPIARSELLRWRAATMATMATITRPPRPLITVVHADPDALAAWSVERSAENRRKSHPPHVVLTSVGKRLSPSLRLRVRTDRVRAHPAVREPLQVSDGSWVCQQRERRARTLSGRALCQAGDPDTAEVARAMKGILNKLTVERFEPLYEQLLATLVDTGAGRWDEAAELLTREVFEKVTMQHHFVDMYAELCQRLHKNEALGSFKRILLDQCQLSFEQHLRPEEASSSLDSTSADDDAILEAETKRKIRMLGNVKFVGALLVKGMLSEKILERVLKELLAYSNDACIECLATFLVVVGPAFDGPAFDRPASALLTRAFQRVERLTRNASLPSRLRCLALDVLDLRATAWQNQKRALRSEEGPMTLDEVRLAAVEEASLAAREASLTPMRSARPELRRKAPLPSSPEALREEFARALRGAEARSGLEHADVEDELASHLARLRLPPHRQAQELVELVYTATGARSATARRLGVGLALALPWSLEVRVEKHHG